MNFKSLNEGQTSVSVKAGLLVLFTFMSLTGVVRGQSNTPINTYPFCQNFDGSANSFDTTWVNAENADINWSENSGETLTPATGPSGDNTTGSGSYVYTEAGGNYNQDAILISPTLDLSEVDFPFFSFYYHMYGVDIGELRAQVYENGSWQTIWSKSGAQQNSSSDAYKRALINIKQYQGKAVRLRIIGTTGSSVRGDMAIDDICVFDSCANISNPPVTSGGFLKERDTVFVNSPFTFLNQYSRKDILNYHYWYLDGQLTKEAYNFEYEFPSTGTYNIELQTQTCAGIDTFNKVVDVKSPTGPPHADFRAQANVVDRFDTAHFEDLSTGGPTDWQWDIRPPSDFNNPKYFPIRDFSVQHLNVLFLEPGLYTVCLTPSNREGTGDQLCKKHYIAVREVTEICASSNSRNYYGTLTDDGGANGDYSSDQETCSYTISPCADSIRLKFNRFDLAYGDYLRIYDGTDPNGEPLWDTDHYGSQGLRGEMSDAEFERFLTASTGQVHVVFEKTSSGTASGFDLDWEADSTYSTPPKAQFEGPDTVCSGNSARFTNNSTTKNPQYSWYAPGSNTQVTSENFQHTFQGGGAQTIKLIVSGCGGADTFSKEVFVKNTVPESDFHANLKQPIAGQEVVTLGVESLNCADSVEWEISPNAYHYVNGTDSNATNPQIILDDTGCYEVTLNTFNDQGKSSTTKQCFIKPSGICLPAVTNLNSDVGINSVKLRSINNRTASGEKAYSSYMTQRATFERGEQGILTISRQTAKNAVNWKAWIDYNNDGKFNDTGELLISSGSTMSRTYTDTFEIPDTVDPGIKRLRIGVSYGAAANNQPCGPNQYGEFEDYALNILPDQTPPEIILEGPDTIVMEACENLAGKNLSARVIDNSGAELQDSLHIDTSNVQNNVPGTYSVTYNVKDQAGNAAEEVERIVTVLPDTTQPVLTLLGAVRDSFRVDSSYNDPGYRVSDNCGSGQVNVDVNSTLDSSIVGIDTITYEVSDQGGNTTVKSRTIRVVDLIAPELTLNGPDTIYTEVLTAFNDPGYTVTDNYDNTLQVNISGNVDTLRTGTYTLTYSVTDASGNGPVQKQRTVIVEDTQAPVVEKANEQDTLTLDVFSELKQPALTVEDNYDKRSELTTQTRGSFNTHFPDLVADSLGVFRVAYVFTDRAGNSDSVVYQVEVVDRVAPEVRLEGPEAVTINVNETYGKGIDTVIDNYDQAPEIDSSGSYFEEFLEEPAAGIYEKQYTATDQSGNTTEKTVHAFVNEASGFAKKERNQQFEVYPNPTQGRFTLKVRLKSERQRLDILITDAGGQKVKALENKRLQSGKMELNLTGYPAGAYFVHIRTKDGHEVIPVSLTQ